MEIIYRDNSADHTAIFKHLHSCGEDFLHELKRRVDLDTYIEKLLASAHRFEAWSENEMVGFLAIYLNPQENFDFITNISVSEQCQKRGIASKLLTMAIAKSANSEIRLEVIKDNTGAIAFYEQAGFKCADETERTYVLSLTR